MLNRIKGLVFGDQGQGMTEYGLVLGVIAIGVVVILQSMKWKITKLMEIRLELFNQPTK